MLICTSSVALLTLGGTLCTPWTMEPASKHNIYFKKISDDLEFLYVPDIETSFCFDTFSLQHFHVLLLTCFFGFLIHITDHTLFTFQDSICWRPQAAWTIWLQRAVAQLPNTEGDQRSGVLWILLGKIQHVTPVETALLFHSLQFFLFLLESITSSAQIEQCPSADRICGESIDRNGQHLTFLL